MVDTKKYGGNFLVLGISIGMKQVLPSKTFNSVLLLLCVCLHLQVTPSPPANWYMAHETSLSLSLSCMVLLSVVSQIAYQMYGPIGSQLLTNKYVDRQRETLNQRWRVNRD